MKYFFYSVLAICITVFACFFISQADGDTIFILAIAFCFAIGYVLKRIFAHFE